MKRITILMVVILAAFVVHSQNVAYSFYFDDVWVKGRNESDGKPGSGKVVIYDNLDVVFEGQSSFFGNFRHTFNIQSGINTLDVWLTLKSDSGENGQSILFLNNGMTAIYCDKRYSEHEIEYHLSSTDKDRNTSTMNSMMSAWQNHTGVFSSFRSLADIELPLKIKGYSSDYRVTSDAGGDEIAYPVRTKTGKIIDQTEFKDYEVSSDAYWIDVSFHTAAAFLLKTQPNNTGRTRTAVVTVKPNKSDITTCMTVTQPAMVAKVNNVWVEHNKLRGLVKGMKIHVNFETFNVRGILGHCCAYFWFANGNKLYDYNGYYRATDGQVSCSGSFNSPYDNTIYSDFELFLPYNELHINGSAECYFMVEIQVSGQSATSKKVSFNVY